MKPYVLRLVKNNGEEETFPYLSMSQKKREDVIRELKENQAHLYCNCVYPEKLEMYFSVDERIIPMHHHYLHADSCPKSLLAKEMAVYNSAFRYKDENQKDIVVNVSLDFSKKARAKVCGGEFRTYRAPVINRKMPVTALIKKLNMVTFQNMAFSTTIDSYAPFDDFCRWIKWKTGHIYIDENRTLQKLSIQEDNMKFFYGEYLEYKNNSDTYVQIVSRLYDSFLNKEKGEREKTTKDLKMSFNQEGINLALTEFERTYNGMTVTSAMDKGYKVVCSGFYTKDTKGFNKCLDIHFILVNKYGLFSESKYEADMYDYICDYLNENKLKSRYVFYKPWEFGESIYQGNYLEDGIIYDKNTDEMFYVEVFGMNTKSYLETKEYKEEVAADKLVKWNAYRNEAKPDLRSFLN